MSFFGMKKNGTYANMTHKILSTVVHTCSSLRWRPGLANRQVNNPVNIGENKRFGAEGSVVDSARRLPDMCDSMTRDTEPATGFPFRVGRAPDVISPSFLHEIVATHVK